MRIRILAGSQVLEMKARKERQHSGPSFWQACSLWSVVAVLDANELSVTGT